MAYGCIHLPAHLFPPFSVLTPSQIIMLDPLKICRPKLCVGSGGFHDDSGAGSPPGVAVPATQRAVGDCRSSTWGPEVPPSPPLNSPRASVEMEVHNCAAPLVLTRLTIQTYDIGTDSTHAVYRCKTSKTLNPMFGVSH